MMKQGFTLVEIIIVVTILCLLAAIAIPSFASARMCSQANACLNNLRQIDGGKEQWAVDNGKVDTDTVTSSDIAPYLKGGWPKCPANGAAYSVTIVIAKPTCGSAMTNHSLSH